MKDLLAWFGLKCFPFDKNIKPHEALDTEPFKECIARLDYIKRRGGILLLTGDPGVGKTLALRRYVDTLNENLFKPYYTTKSKGLGLGLAYSQKAVEAHGGIIGVESTVGKGTVFKILMKKRSSSPVKETSD